MFSSITEASSVYLLANARSHCDSDRKPDKKVRGHRYLCPSHSCQIERWERLVRFCRIEIVVHQCHFSLLILLMCIHIISEGLYVTRSDDTVQYKVHYNLSTRALYFYPHTIIFDLSVSFKLKSNTLQSLYILYILYVHTCRHARTLLFYLRWVLGTFFLSDVSYNTAPGH